MAWVKKCLFPSARPDQQETFDKVVDQVTKVSLDGSNKSYAFGYPTGIDEYYTVFNRILGEGAFGTVHEARRKEGGHLVAIKRISKVKHLVSEVEKRDLRLEVDVLNRIGTGSLNCVSLHEVFEDNKYVYMVMEHAGGGTLMNRLTKCKSFEEKEAIRIARWILQMIAQCHAKDIVYRDVKLENFVYITQAPDSILKAIDFGLAVHKPPGSPPLDDITGSPYFVAPEVIRQSYSFQCDLWSVGVLLYILLSGERPFKGNNKAKGEAWVMSVLREIIHQPVVFAGGWWDRMSATGRDFLIRLLEKDPEMRMTVKEALAHPWLNSNVFSSSRRGSAHLFQESLVARLQRFATYGALKQEAMFEVVRQNSLSNMIECTARQKSAACLRVFFEENQESIKLVHLFKKMDKSGKGTVSAEEAKRGLNKAGFDVTLMEVQPIWEAASRNGNGEVDVTEFMAAFLDWKHLEVALQQGGGCVDDIYRQVFDRFRKKGHDYLELADIARVMKEQEGHPKVAAMMAWMDVDGTGMIPFEKFKEAMMNDKDDLDIYDLRLRKKNTSLTSPATGPNGPDMSLKSLASWRSWHDGENSERNLSLKNLSDSIKRLDMINGSTPDNDLLNSSMNSEHSTR